MVKKIINTIPQCSIATECKNNTCLLRMGQVFGYPLIPESKKDYDKINEIEKRYGRGDLPNLTILFREGKARVECADFKER